MQHSEKIDRYYEMRATFTSLQNVRHTDDDDDDEKDEKCLAKLTHHHHMYVCIRIRLLFFTSNLMKSLRQ